MQSLVMKSYSHAPLTSLILAGLLLISQTFAQGSTKDAKATSRAAANIRSVPEVPIPQSLFTLPGQPGEGRNPFFPQSSVRVIVPPRLNPQNPVETYTFVLNGITSPPKRTAMINGRTFEPGEEGEVRLPSGAKMMIKCEEIKAESAIIVVSGQRRELRLRSGV
jgi:hypothetical protein